MPNVFLLNNVYQELSTITVIVSRIAAEIRKHSAEYGLWKVKVDESAENNKPP